MVFKKFDNQQVYQVECKNPSDSAALNLVVGDMFSHNPNTKEIVKITTKAAAVTAVGNGLNLYIIAQSDAVTEKTGTAYKTYIIGRNVDIAVGATKIVAAYGVDTIENVEGLE